MSVSLGLIKGGSGWLQRGAQVKEPSLCFWVLAAELYIFAETHRTMHHKECTLQYANTHIPNQHQPASKECQGHPITEYRLWQMNLTVLQKYDLASLKVLQNIATAVLEQLWDSIASHQEVD